MMTSNNTNFSRRRFVTATSTVAMVAGASAILGGSLMPAAKSHAQSATPSSPLKIPAENRGTENAGKRVYDLTVQNGMSEFFPGVKTPTSGINGDYLGPTLRMREGDQIRINVASQLGEDSTLHWHGVHLPASQDGGPHQVVKTGETWSPEFEVKQKAASLWYHSHLMGKTAEHVWRGLAGMIIIDDEETDALALPNTYGVDDVPIILQDRNFSRNGRMDYDPSMHSTMMGMIGEVPMVNGTIAPYFEATTKFLRLRVLNGSNASIYNLGLSNDKPFKQIATDGGLLEAPVEVSRITLATGERAEIIVELTPGEPVSLLNFAGSTEGRGSGMMGQGRGMGMMGGMMASNTGDFTFLEIRPGNELSSGADVPAKLTTMNWLNETDATKTRRFDMEMNMGPRVMLGLIDSHLINGKVMKLSRIDEKVKMGDTEIWEIRNTSNVPHPFHMHDVQFQILDRNGKKPAPNEQGRKDTVLVGAGEVARIIMKFEDFADAETPYMYHCHILEHEDAGMMGQFTVS